jgi:hypothetical protein
MVDSETLKEQTTYSLRLHDVRKAVAAYELMHSTYALMQMLPIPVLMALRDYLKEDTKDRKNPLTLCDRGFVECINELIAGERLRERRLFQGITGIVPPPE